jgi:aminoglycoside phosphotransferase (APT) family kinase protein
MAGSTLSSESRRSTGTRPSSRSRLFPAPRSSGTSAASWVPRRCSTAKPQSWMASRYLNCSTRAPTSWVISVVNGAPWANAARHLSAADRSALLRELGQIAARIHTLPCPDGRFGCPAPQAGLLARDWRAAFTAMVEAILDDAGRWDSPIGIAPSEVRQMLADGSDALGEVRRASLIHFDLWPGNIFITARRPTPGSPPRVTGIIDHERAFWGDPAAELEQLALDPLVSPAIVVGGEPLDQRGDLGADWRPSAPDRLDPAALSEPIARLPCAA